MERECAVTRLMCRTFLAAGVLLCLLFAGQCLWPARSVADAPLPGWGGGAASAPAEEPPPVLRWTSIRPGLELGLASLPQSRGTGARFVVLRIDPEQHAFVLSMASESGQPYSLAEWSRERGLLAGINASMYLPDQKTSTGYMRSGGTVNNSAMGGRLGAFFVSGPKKAVGGKADIIERDSPGWRERLDEYDIVVQNYRFISGTGKMLWREKGPLHSIAVVAKDGRGRMLFVLSQEPLAAGDFAEWLRAFELGVRVAMYVEGGAQAGLFVRLDAEEGGALPGASAHPVPGGVVHVWKGRQSLLNVRGNPDAALPNILGVPLP